MLATYFIRAKIGHFGGLEILGANMWLIFLIGMLIGPHERVQCQSGPLIQFAIRYSFGVGDAVSENGIGESDPITRTRKTNRNCRKPLT